MKAKILYTLNDVNKSVDLKVDSLNPEVVNAALVKSVPNAKIMSFTEVKEPKNVLTPAYGDPPDFLKKDTFEKKDPQESTVTQPFRDPALKDPVFSDPKDSKDLSSRPAFGESRERKLDKDGFPEASSPIMSKEDFPDGLPLDASGWPTDLVQPLDKSEDIHDASPKPEPREVIPLRVELEDTAREDKRLAEQAAADKAKADAATNKPVARSKGEKIVAGG